MGDRVSSSLTGRTNKTGIIPVFFYASETLLCSAQRTYGAELTPCEWRSFACASTLISLSRRFAPCKYTLARTLQGQVSYLSFFCAQVDLCGVQHHVLRTELTPCEWRSPI